MKNISTLHYIKIVYGIFLNNEKVKDDFFEICHYTTDNILEHLPDEINKKSRPLTTRIDLNGYVTEVVKSIE